MHGSGSTTFMTETYGYARLAAEKGFILTSEGDSFVVVNPDGAA